MVPNARIRRCSSNVALIAAQAHSRKEDRAVVISTRNFLRSTGGAAGLALSNAIFSNILKGNIPREVPGEVVTQIEVSIFGIHDLSGLSSADRNGILDAYMKAARGIFILWAVAMVMCLLLMTMIKDNGLKRKEEETETAPQEDRDAAEKLGMSRGLEGVSIVEVKI